VINLSPDKKRVFEEAFRVLKSGGRLMVSDIVLLEKLPKSVKENVKAYVGCVSGAEMKDKYLQLIKEAGFQQVEVIEENRFPIDNLTSDSTARSVMKALRISEEKAEKLINSVISIKVSAFKP